MTATWKEKELQAGWSNDYQKDLLKHLQNGIKTMQEFDPGYVYLLGSEPGYFKIGKTKNLKQRLDNFGVKLPFEVWVEHKIYTFDCTWLEKFFHLFFYPFRVGGEWFKLDSIYLDLIKNFEDDKLTDNFLGMDNKMFALQGCSESGLIELSVVQMSSFVIHRQAFLERNPQLVAQLKGKQL